MARQRNFVTFDSNLSDDPVFADSGDIEVPGGRIVSEEIADQLRKNGLFVSDPQQYDYYAWEFTAKSDSVDVWMLLQLGENWLLIIENRRHKSGWFRNSMRTSHFTLDIIDKSLSESPSFGNVTWYTRQEYESEPNRGSRSPNL